MIKKLLNLFFFLPRKHECVEVYVVIKGPTKIQVVTHLWVWFMHLPLKWRVFFNGFVFGFELFYQLWLTIITGAFISLMSILLQFEILFIIYICLIIIRDRSLEFLFSIKISSLRGFCICLLLLTLQIWKIRKWK